MSADRLPAAALLDHAWIAARIPHGGTMCVLDAVVAWDDAQIRCIATGHRSADNPLRSQGRLATVCGIEYAAQAMAVHGALLGGASGRPSAGMLASVRDIEARVARLDTVAGPLDVDAARLGGDAHHVLYRFALSCAGELLLSGRAAVVLDAHAFGAAPPASDSL